MMRGLSLRKGFTPGLFRGKRYRIGLLVVMAVVFVSLGCEAVFTSAPLSFLQRDPANLSADQKMAFAENALASGDAEAISDAYAAVADYIDSNDLSGSEAVEANSMAADLLAADTGVGPLFDQVVADFVDGEEVDPAEIEQMIQELSVSEDDGAAMESYMDAVIDNEGTPEPMQAVLAAGVIMAPVISNEDISDEDLADTEEAAAAAEILEAAAAGMEDDSTLAEMASMLGVASL